MTLSPRKQGAISRDIFVSIGERHAPGILWAETGVLLSVLQPTRQPLTTENYPALMSGVLRLRNWFK